MTSVAPHPTTYHQDHFSAAPQAVASAPGTWALIGEHTEGFGGIVVLGTTTDRVTVTLGPSPHPRVQVAAWLGGTTHTEEITIEELESRALAQQPRFNDSGQPLIPPTPAGGMAARLGGLIWMLRHRQLLGREPAGFVLGVVSELSPDEGLGLVDAAEAALALALHADSPEVNEVPLRAKLAEVASQAAATFAHQPSLRSRHTAVLRAIPGELAVIDYADESVTKAPLVTGADTEAILVLPKSVAEADLSNQLRRRRRFLASAAHAFGADCVRRLPDATERIAQWLQASHEVYGPAGYPSLDEATQWLAFWDAEAKRAELLAAALRSRRRRVAEELLGTSATELAKTYGLQGMATRVAELALAHGARAARPTAAGLAPGVVAIVEKRHAENFLADLTDEGFRTRVLHLGEPARLEV